MNRVNRPLGLTEITFAKISSSISKKRGFKHMIIDPNMVIQVRNVFLL